MIKQALEAKIAKLEAEQVRKLKKTEKDSLKDEVLHSRCRVLSAVLARQ